MPLNFKSIPTYPAPVRIFVFLGILLVLWLPLALPIVLIAKNNPNLVSLLTMPCLYLLFLGLTQWWGKKLYGDPNLLCRYGLKNNIRNWQEFLQGWFWGGGICGGVFLISGKLGWLVWQNPSQSLLKIALEGFVIAAVIGLAEEVVFRGWLLLELERDYGLYKAGYLSSLIFAIAHFLKPLPEIIRTLPQFPGLLGLGLILVLAKRLTQGRLGLSIGLHAGLVWGYYLLNVGNLIRYTQKIPDWVTGIDGNPLAGLMGWIGLLCLTGLLYYSRSIFPQRRTK